jgi:hypothetical protein
MVSMYSHDFPFDRNFDMFSPGDPGGVGRFLRASPAEALDPSSLGFSEWMLGDETVFFLCFVMISSYLCS